MICCAKSTAQGSCVDTNWLKITIVPHTVAAFKTTVLDAVLTCENTSLYGSKWLWGFGDGTTSNAQSPIHTYRENGLYSVRLTTINDCDSSTTSQKIAINGICQTLYPPSVSQIKSRSARVSWQGVSGTRQYLIEYKRSIDNTWTSLIVMDTSVYLTDLKTNTAYHIRLNALCSSANKNVVSTETNFKTIKPQDDPAPDMITPNGDGANDTFIIPELADDPSKYPNNELVIVNRWGAVVYRAKPYKNEWAGTNQHGDDLPTGTYYYMMRLDIANGEIKTGDVLVVR